MRSVVSTYTGDIPENNMREVFGKPGHSFDRLALPRFDVRTTDSKGNRVDSLSGTFDFGEDFRELLMNAIPAAAAVDDGLGYISRRQSNIGKPEFIGRVYKGALGESYKNADWTKNDEFDEALQSLLALYDSNARKYPFDPDYINSISETPQRFITDFISALSKGDIPAQVLHPDWRDRAKAISDALRDNSYDEFLEGAGQGVGMALDLMERTDPGYIDRFLKDIEADRFGGRVKKLRPAIEQLVENTAFNRSPNSMYSKTKAQVRDDRYAALDEYGDWLQKLSPDIPLNDLKDFAKHISVGRSGLLTNILNDSLDFTPLLAPILKDYNDPEGRDRVTGNWVPLLPGLWSPTRRSMPMMERAALPFYNFKSDSWKNYAKKNGPHPLRQLELTGFDPGNWGGAESYADYDGTTKVSKRYGATPIDYLRMALRQRKGGYYPYVDFEKEFGINIDAELDKLNNKERQRRLAVTDKRENSRQEREMVGDSKTNIRAWSGMKDSEKNNSFKSMLKAITNRKNDAYATAAVNMGIDNIAYSDIMDNADLKAKLRATHDALRDAGTPLNDVGNTLLQIIADSADNISVSGIANTLMGKL